MTRNKVPSMTRFRTRFETSVRRDLAKTLSFMAVHFAVAFGVAYALTGSAMIATGIALIEPLANTIAFFFHERAWNARWGEDETGQALLVRAGRLDSGS